MTSRPWLALVRTAARLDHALVNNRHRIQFRVPTATDVSFGQIATVSRPVASGDDAAKEWQDERAA